MPEYLEFKVDKFTFRIATDRFYSPQGVWAQPEGRLIRIGISDFLQQRSGDVAFVDAPLVGTRVEAGGEIAQVETIKVNLSLESPVSGQVVEVNPAMETAPEAINQDPYGSGWLAVIEAADWDSDRLKLFDPLAYFDQAKTAAGLEGKQE